MSPLRLPPLISPLHSCLFEHLSRPFTYFGGLGGLSGAHQFPLVLEPKLDWASKRPRLRYRFFRSLWLCHCVVDRQEGRPHHQPVPIRKNYSTLERCPPRLDNRLCDRLLGQNDPPPHLSKHCLNWSPLGKVCYLSFFLSRKLVSQHSPGLKRPIMVTVLRVFLLLDFRVCSAHPDPWAKNTCGHHRLASRRSQGSPAFPMLVDRRNYLQVVQKLQAKLLAISTAFLA